MAVNTKIIKRRIKSIGSTKKITKAMEMISAVKMRRAVHNVLASRDYARLAAAMLKAVAKVSKIEEHPLLVERKIKRVGVVLVTSNRGLAGGFNSRLLQAVHNFIKSLTIDNSPLEAEVILAGKRGKKIYHRYGHAVAAEFTKLDLTTKVEEILPMARTIISDYLSGRYDKIVLAYTDYVSAIAQEPRIVPLLPLVDLKVIARIGKVVSSESAPEINNGDTKPLEYLFEPDPKDVLAVLLPRLIESQIYQAVLESDASEHSARMLAMKNASDAARDMIKELQYNFNKARQAAITQEIAEIVGGAAALN
ncbi:MAG: ATP synthase F1 subunit gamma [Candidatus Magasanikbacteria bacterium]|nr:ATP synthase F1 subunit gamma [Candidatus Magasanikbacteria bacterium]